MKRVVVVTGPGQIGQAIARRVGAGKHLRLADVRQDNADAAAEVLANAGYEVTVATAYWHQKAEFGDIQTAGSPSPLT